LNGPENISQHIRLPIADQPTLGIFRLSPTQAKNFGLRSDQIIRGIVGDDGKTIEFYLAGKSKKFASNLVDWKGKAPEFRVSMNGEGATLTLNKTHSGSPLSQIYPTNAQPSYNLNPGLLLTMLSNPAFSKLNVFNKGSSAFVEWLRINFPALSGIISSSLSASKIDSSSIKEQLRNNGFKNISKKNISKNASSDFKLLDSVRFLIENFSEMSDSINGFVTLGDLEKLSDYLNANSIEHIIRHEQREFGIRFVLLFVDFPAAEIYIRGEHSNPKKHHKHKWAIEIKLSFSENNNIWGRIELIGDKALAISLLMTDLSVMEIAKSNLPHLYNLFEAKGIILTSCSINIGSYEEIERKDLLRERGNLDLIA
jgi:hypothetical protein